MSTATGDNGFLHELEADIRTDLTVAEASEQEERVVEWLPDPAAQRYEVSLRNLLGAVEAMEDGSDPSGHPGQAE